MNFELQLRQRPDRVAQRLAAQLVPRAMSIGDFPMRRIREWGPLGHIRYLVTILTGK
jgi:hypothetical protein